MKTMVGTKQVNWSDIVMMIGIASTRIDPDSINWNDRDEAIAEIAAEITNNVTAILNGDKPLTDDEKTIYKLAELILH